MGKKKRRLLSPKFANWRKANGIGVDTATKTVEPAIEEDKVKVAEPVVETVEEPVKEPVAVVETIEEPVVEEKQVEKPKTTRSSTKKTTSSTTKKTTSTTRRKRTTKAKPTTTDI